VTWYSATRINLVVVISFYSYVAIFNVNKTASIVLRLNHMTLFAAENT